MTFQTPKAASSPSGDRARALPYLPGLDGLRAISVIAVLLYHGDVLWIPGGFLGVEVFFVISGYLITTLLLAEWERSGHISPPRFWLRRARRLLPALFAMLIAVTVYAVAFLPSELARLKGDLLAAFTYVTNWYLIFKKESYFEAAGRPSLLKHLWSLAVEEQFYIVWPLMLASSLAVLKRRRTPAAIALLALASAGLMAWLYVPGSDPSRVYYGTDTRASGLLLGALAAFLWRPWLRRSVSRRLDRWLLDLTGLLALAGIVGCFLVMDEYGAALYRGGFLYLDLLTLALIAATADPAGRLGRWLGVAPLRWVGLRSYAVYLWHWPVFMVTRGWVDVALDGWALFGLRCTVTVALAELSYRIVEQPIRRGELGRRIGVLRARQPRAALSPASRFTVPVTACAAIIVAMGLSTYRLSAEGRAEPLPVLTMMREWESARASSGPGSSATPQRHDTPTVVARVRATATPSRATRTRPVPRADGTPSGPSPSAPAQATLTLDQVRALMAAAMWLPESDALAKLGPDRAAGAGQSAVPPRSTDSNVPGPGVRATATVAATATRRPPTLTPPVPGRALLLGDSVMLGASSALRSRFGPRAIIDAEVSRQFVAGTEALRAYRADGLDPEIVVIHLGSNGALSSAQFDEMMGVLRDVARVYLVTAKVPRRWEGTTNAELADGVKRWANARLLDWHTISLRQRNLFRDDGYHLTPEGAEYYADFIALSIADDYGRSAWSHVSAGAWTPMPIQQSR